MDYESNLIQLWKDLNYGSYQPGKSIAFIVHKPVQREIFAADFRDRVVHHLIINKLNPLFEKEFIQDSYACRVGKGTHHGISRANKFIRQCSKNYKEDCHVSYTEFIPYLIESTKEQQEMIEQLMKQNETQQQIEAQQKQINELIKLVQQK